jgi:GNAT superfamily N-acetyltransferase
MRPDYHIRRATTHDATVVARHRVAMFRDMGDLPDEAIAEQLFESSRTALAAFLADGSYAGWLAVTGGGDVLGGAGAHVKPQLPRIAPNGARLETAPVPLVVNVYTEPRCRRTGIARALMQELLRWAVVEGFDRVLLHASAAGRPLYASLGFVATNEMRWAPGAPGAIVDANE